MVDIGLGRFAAAQVVLEGVDAAHAADPGTEELPVIGSDYYTMVRIFATFGGTVTDADLDVWVQEGEDWFFLESVELDPSTDGQAVDVMVGAGTRFGITVSNLSGSGGEITVSVRGIA